MTTRDENGAHAANVAPQGMTYQKQANRRPELGTLQQPAKAPRKWQRVLSAFLTGRSFNRFQAERPISEGGLSDHCLHSTVAEIQEHGIRISRKFEQVPGFQGLPTSVKRYWLDLGDIESVSNARELVGESLKAAA